MNFIWILAAAFAAQGAQPPMSVDDAIRIAYQNSFSIKAARSAWEKTHQEANEAKGHLGPSVALSASDTHYEPGIPSFAILPDNTFQLANQRDADAAVTTVALPVDLSGNLGRAVNAAKAAERGALDAVNAAANNVRHDVRRAFYAVLAAQESLQVNQQALVDADRRLKDTQAQFDAGTAAKVDVLRAQVQDSSAKIDLRAAQNTLDLARQSFNNTLGRAIDTPFSLQPVHETPELNSDEEELVKIAWQRRPDLLSLKENAKVLGLVTKVNEAGLQPSLSLSAEFERDLKPPQGQRVSQTVGVAAITWPIFDSGITRARVKEARQDEAQNQIGIDQLSLGISLQVRSAVKNLQNAADRLKLAQEQVGVAEEAFRLSNVRHDAGEGILLEVIDAQTDLTQARVGEVSARYDYLSAFADLQQAIGVDQVQQSNPNSGAKK